MNCLFPSIDAVGPAQFLPWVAHDFQNLQNLLSRWGWGAKKTLILGVRYQDGVMSLWGRVRGAH